MEIGQKKNQNFKTTNSNIDHYVRALICEF